MHHLLTQTEPLPAAENGMQKIHFPFITGSGLTHRYHKSTPESKSFLQRMYNQ